MGGHENTGHVCVFAKGVNTNLWGRVKSDKCSRFAAASDQENLVTNDSEPAGPLSAINEVRASAVDEVRPFRQERGPKNLHSDRKPRPNAQGSRPFQSTLTDITERDTNSGGPSSDRKAAGRSFDRKGKGRESDRKGKGIESDRKGK